MRSVTCGGVVVVLAAKDSWESFQRPIRESVKKKGVFSPEEQGQFTKVRVFHKFSRFLWVVLVFLGKHLELRKHLFGELTCESAFV